MTISFIESTSARTWELVSLVAPETERPGEDGHGSCLLFSHRDFDPDNPVIPVITPAWAQFLLNLKAVAESGRANRRGGQLNH